MKIKFPKPFFNYFDIILNSRLIMLLLIITCFIFAVGVILCKDFNKTNQLFFVVEIKSSQCGVSQVFYDINRGYNEHDSHSIAVQKEKLQTLNFALTGNAIKSIRFDPINTASLVRMKDARIEDRQGNVIKILSPKDFIPLNQIDKVEIVDDTLIIQTIKNANDPIMRINNSSIDRQTQVSDYIKKRAWVIIGYSTLIFLALICFSYCAIFYEYKKHIIGVINFAALCFSLLVMARWWCYIDAYSVNILFWDQWGFYNALFDHNNLWELFSWQSGPHRQGIGLIFTKTVASLSGWNTRMEAFAIGGIVFLAMFVALFIRMQLGVRLQWADAAIPLIFLTPRQYEIFAGTPFPAIGGLPLFLLMLYGLAWVAWRGALRCGAIIVLNFLLIYTGYGIFAAMITPFVFSAEALHSYRACDRQGIWLAVTGLILSLLSAGSFFIGYRFMTGVEGFQFPISEWWLYPKFIALMLANFCGVKGVNLFSYIVGFSLFSFMGVLALVHFGRVLSFDTTSRSPVDAIIVVSIIYTMIFCAGTAVGRVSLGLPAAQSSRYITNMIPGFLGIYLWLVTLPPGTMRQFLMALIIIVLLSASFPLRETDRNKLTWLAEGKARWKAAYLQTEDIELATRTANFRIHPEPEAIRLKHKLEYLKKEKLNLYLDLPEPGSSEKCLRAGLCNLFPTYIKVK